MKKLLPYIFILIFVGVFVVPQITHAQTAIPGNIAGIPFSMFPSWEDITMKAVAPFVTVILRFISLLTGIAAIFLNGVVYYTVVKISDNYTLLTPILEAWKVLRDIANISFIFVLLYAGIKTIIGQGENQQRLITNVIVVAVLMNFSLFFTRVVIDASNVLAITFYDAIAPGALQAGPILEQAGLSNAFMKYLNVQTLYELSGQKLSPMTLITIGLLGSLLLIITAFVFAAVAMLFIIRYVVLILVLILSPIAFVAFALPNGLGVGKYKDQWISALTGQAFFAPIYFLLTWIALKVMGGINTALAISSDPNLASQYALSGLAVSGDGVTGFGTGPFVMLINFVIVIILIIVSLTLSKEWADKAGGGMGKLTSWATNAAGGALGGGTGWVGKKTLGRSGDWLSTREGVQRWANEEKGAKGAVGRLALYAGKKARSGTFDPRNATIPVNAVGDLIEGTAGRTRFGKKLGLDEVKTPLLPSIGVGGFVAGQTMAGKGSTEGYREEQAAKAKRLDAQKKAQSDEYRQVKAEVDINAGAKGTATPAEIQAMEKMLSKMSDKEIEAIVESNKELLEKQEFANAISVKQLEALNKSDKFSDEEKDKLKSRRFAAINDGRGLAALAIPPATRTPAQVAEANKISTAIKALKDPELEMINPALLSDPHIVGQLRQPQVDAIIKSNKFTSSQQNTVRTLRRKPLMDALTAGNISTIQSEIKRVDAKTLASFMNALGRGGINIALDPAVLPTYTPQILKRMAQEMNAADIQTLRTAILAGGNPATITWLNNPTGGMVDFI
mgnify:CR=1 FL=1